MSVCGVCTYLDILESTAPSDRVMDVARELRAHHDCSANEPEPERAHPATMIGKR